MSDQLPSSAPIVAVRAVGYRYPGSATEAVDGVSLDVGPGEVVGVAGRNGSGKTTLARLVTGLLRPQTGSATVNGMDTTSRDVRQLAANAGYVFQSPGHQLFASTVEEELAFGPRNLGVPEAEIRARIAGTADRLGLSAILAHHPYRLGLAQRKLVAIASVLTMRTPVLVLDEPTTGQDHRSVSTIEDLVHELRRGGTTVLVIGHDLAFLARSADRIVILDAGRVIGDGPTRDMLSDAALLARAQLVPPQATTFSRGLPRPPAGSGVPWPALSVGEAVALVRTAAGDRPDPGPAGEGPP